MEPKIRSEVKIIQGNYSDQTGIIVDKTQGYYMVETNSSRSNCVLFRIEDWALWFEIISR